MQSTLDRDIYSLLYSVLFVAFLDILLPKFISVWRKTNLHIADRNAILQVPWPASLLHDSCMANWAGRNACQTSSGSHQKNSVCTPCVFCQHSRCVTVTIWNAQIPNHWGPQSETGPSRGVPKNTDTVTRSLCGLSWRGLTGPLWERPLESQESLSGDFVSVRRHSQLNLSFRYMVSNSRQCLVILWRGLSLKLLKGTCGTMQSLVPANVGSWGVGPVD